MEDDGKTLPFGLSDASCGNQPSGDSGKKAAVGAQTPPPESDISDAPTLPHPGDSPVGSTPAPPLTPVSDSDLGKLALLMPGVVLGGRYRILRILGQGGMGAVYQARDQELDRVIALKVIRPEWAGNPAILQRFKQELILARHVTHKNVVRIYDLGEADGIRFITMEYVEGDDLRTLLIGEIRAALDKHLATLPENERVVPYVRRPRVAPAACAPRVVRTQPLAFRSALRPPVASGGSR